MAEGNTWGFTESDTTSGNRTIIEQRDIPIIVMMHSIAVWSVTHSKAENNNCIVKNVQFNLRNIANVSNT